MTDDTLTFEPVRTFTVTLERAEQSAENGDTHEHFRATLSHDGADDVVRSGPTAEDALSAVAAVLHAEKAETP